MRWRQLLVLILLAGCSRRAPPPSEKPIDVAAAMAACAGSADCESKCAAGVAGACVEAGRLYEFGHTGTADPARAFPFYDRACTLGFVGGCFNAAVLLESGRAVSQDRQRAARLYAQVCQAGSKTACARAEALAERGN